jgi:hypothetical protein
MEMLVSMHCAGWAELAAGRRCFLFSDLAEVSSYYRQLGYAPLPARTEGAISSDVFALDVRHVGMAAWLTRRLAPSTVAPTVKAGAVTPDAVRAALSLLHRPDALNDSELAFELGCDGDWLRRLLVGLLSELPAPPPLDGSAQQLLRMTYVQHHRSSISVARAAHLSRSTYYRHLDRALHALADVLSRRLAASLPPPRSDSDARPSAS